MRYIALFALFAFEATTIKVEHPTHAGLGDAVHCAAEFGPRALQWWSELTSGNEEEILDAKTAVNAWVGLVGPMVPNMTDEQAQCAWVKAKGSNLAFLSDVETDDCHINGSEFAAALVVASIWELECSPEELAVLNDCLDDEELSLGQTTTECGNKC